MTTENKYSTIDMPMDVFMNAFCDGDLSQVDNFQDVILQYYECSADNEITRVMTDALTYEMDKLKYLTAQSLILQLSATYNESKFEQLKSLNFHLLIPSPSLDNVNEYIEQISGWLKLAYVNLVEAERDLNKSQNKGEDIVQDRNYFIDRFLAVETALGIHLTEKDSVRRFCRAMKQLRQYYREQENTKIKQPI